jgi:hypothetical protein
MSASATMGAKLGSAVSHGAHGAILPGISNTWFFGGLVAGLATLGYAVRKGNSN